MRVRTEWKLIDIRYHVVSLIAVFFALAIGVILGAGPLKETIGSQLTGQVSQLREERQAMREELDVVTRELSGADQFVAATAHGIVADKLANRRVAVVSTGSIDADDSARLASLIADAGGEVVTTVELQPGWASSEYADSRQSYAESLAEYLPADFNGSYDQVLGRALGLALSGSSDAFGSSLSNGARLVREILVSAELISIVDDGDLPADLVVILDEDSVATVPADLTADELSQVEESSAVIANTAQQLGGSAEAAVVVGQSDSPGTLIGALRSDVNLRSAVSTVTDVHLDVGRVIAVLALSDQIGGKVGHYTLGQPDVTYPTGSEPGPLDRSWMLTLGADDSTMQAGDDGTTVPDPSVPDTSDSESTSPDSEDADTGVDTGADTETDAGALEDPDAANDTAGDQAA